MKPLDCTHVRVDTCSHDALPASAPRQNGLTGMLEHLSCSEPPDEVVKPQDQEHMSWSTRGIKTVGDAWLTDICHHLRCCTVAERSTW